MGEVPKQVLDPYLFEALGGCNGSEVSVVLWNFRSCGTEAPDPLGGYWSFWLDTRLLFLKTKFFEFLLLDALFFRSSLEACFFRGFSKARFFRSFLETELSRYLLEAEVFQI